MEEGTESGYDVKSTDVGLLIVIGIRCRAMHVDVVV